MKKNLFVSLPLLFQKFIDLQITLIFFFLFGLERDFPQKKSNNQTSPIKQKCETAKRKKYILGTTVHVGNSKLRFSSSFSFPVPTNNAKWKLSRNIYTLHTRLCTFGGGLYAQAVLSNKISALELSRKFIKSALLVGMTDNFVWRIASL